MAQRGPYDSGTCSAPPRRPTSPRCRSPRAYLVRHGTVRYGTIGYLPESSRRARGFATLGGVARVGSPWFGRPHRSLLRAARRFPARSVVLNVNVALWSSSVLVTFGDMNTPTGHRAVQRDARLLADDVARRRFMRISVSNWTTTEADVDRSIEAIASSRAAAEPRVAHSEGKAPAFLVNICLAIRRVSIVSPHIELCQLAERRFDTVIAVSSFPRRPSSPLTFLSASRAHHPLAPLPQLPVAAASTASGCGASGDPRSTVGRSRFAQLRIGWNPSSMGVAARRASGVRASKSR